jgi:hypothetical protein
MEGFIAVCATAKRWEALVPNKRANNGLAGDTYANEGVPRESILGCAHNITPSLLLRAGAPTHLKPACPQGLWLVSR